MKILYSFQAFFAISQKTGITQCVKTAMCILSFIHLAPKLIPCFWPIFTDFQIEVFSSNLNISAKYEPNQALDGSKSKWAQNKMESVPTFEIKDLVFMLRELFYSFGRRNA